MATSVIRGLAWRERAACRGMGDLFLSPDRVREASRICESCPVLLDCYEEGQRLEPGMFGMYGGRWVRRPYRDEEIAVARDEFLGGRYGKDVMLDWLRGQSDDDGLWRGNWRVLVDDFARGLFDERTVRGWLEKLVRRGYLVLVERAAGLAAQQGALSLWQVR